MSSAASPFRPGVVALLLLVGFGAFLLLLYALGQGWTGGSERNGGEHAASNGLTGFAGLAELLEASGQQVELSRNAGRFDEYGLLVLTPPVHGDADEIAETIASRRYIGPTLLVLPKWAAMPAPGAAEAEPGWVVLGDAMGPGWFADLPLPFGGAREEDTGTLVIGQTGGWQGYGATGPLPDAGTVQAFRENPAKAGDFQPLVVDSEGDLLAAYDDDRGDDGAWPVYVVFEPDLLNNYGLANEKRALLAMAIIDSALEYEPDGPIIFDLTMAGLGASENLLSLAFRPPFLAATLCLVLAALVLAWRGFHRFGPPQAEATSAAKGKRQLAANSASLIERVRRWHLLKAPYVQMVSARLARQLNVRAGDDQTRESAIDKALAARGAGEGRFVRLAQDLRAAEKPGDILRAASALREFERTQTR